jgi:hypothetical protein
MPSCPERPPVLLALGPFIRRPSAASEGATDEGAEGKEDGRGIIPRGETTPTEKTPSGLSYGHGPFGIRAPRTREQSGPSRHRPGLNLPKLATVSVTRSRNWERLTILPKFPKLLAQFGLRITAILELLSVGPPVTVSVTAITVWVTRRHGLSYGQSRFELRRVTVWVTRRHGLGYGFWPCLILNPLVFNIFCREPRGLTLTLVKLLRRQQQ